MFKYITITRHKREIIFDSGGKNIAPSRVEGMLAFEPEIEQVMVDGDKKPWLTAVIVPSASVMEGHADHVEKMVADAVRRENARFSAPELLRRFILADEAFTVANGQMTATLKVRRHVVRDVYGERFDVLYPKK